MKKRILLLLILAGAQLYGAAGSSASISNDEKLLDAVRRGKVDQVKSLLKQPGINLNVKDKAPADSKRLHAGGNTPLDIAFDKLRRTGRKDYKEISELLIQQKLVQANISNDAQARPLHMLAGFVPKTAPEEELKAPTASGVPTDRPERDPAFVADVAKKFIDKKKPDLNARDEDGRTPLHWAATSGYPELAKTFIRDKANINARDNDGRTPLMKAAQKGNIEVMKALLDAGADPNLADFNKGRTALHWVQRMREGATEKSGNQMTKERALKAINLLLEKKANPTLKDKEANKSAIDWAKEKSPYTTGENLELKALEASPLAPHKQTPTPKPEPSTSGTSIPTPSVPIAGPSNAPPGYFDRPSPTAEAPPIVGLDDIMNLYRSIAKHEAWDELPGVVRSIQGNNKYIQILEAAKNGDPRFAKYKDGAEQILNAVDEALARELQEEELRTAREEPQTQQPQASTSGTSGVSESGWVRVLKNIEDYREIARFGDPAERAALLRKFLNDPVLLAGLNYGYDHLGDDRAETILAKLGLLD